MSYQKIDGTFETSLEIGFNQNGDSRIMIKKGADAGMTFQEKTEDYKLEMIAGASALYLYENVVGGL